MSEPFLAIKKSDFEDIMSSVFDVGYRTAEQIYEVASGGELQIPDELTVELRIIQKNKMYDSLEKQMFRRGEDNENY